MSAAAIKRLPDPDLFRDANLLASSAGFPGSARDLDETDALLLSLVRTIRTTKVTRGR